MSERDDDREFRETLAAKTRETRQAISGGTDAVLERCRRAEVEVDRLRAEIGQLGRERDAFVQAGTRLRLERDAILKAVIVEVRRQRSDGIQHRWVTLYRVLDRDFDSFELAVTAVRKAAGLDTPTPSGA